MRAVILREAWEYNARLRKNPGYTQVIEHIGYILGGYDLYTFNMVQANILDAPSSVREKQLPYSATTDNHG
ncbi:hypothetical protein [Klebsiella oxytoca]|uniref:hypothetical protein n=1 Tax=Klebsiella oxytoca TaxID=571 RepID=UPI00224553A3|nr:hypothetical protein [Klebsiella oxytoca]MCW9445984.1 hypothetical protein [Klebsiella oxytoca]